MSVDLCIIVATVAGIFYLGFLLTVRVRTVGDTEQLLDRIHRRQEQLLPYVANDNNTADMDGQLWAAIGGVRGLMQLPRDAFSLLSVCASLGFKEKDPGEHEINTRRVETIILATFGAAVEASVTRVVPWMPRPYMHLVATEYWRICVSMQTLVAAYRPNMIERVAEVL